MSNPFGNPWMELIVLEEAAVVLTNYCCDMSANKVFINPDHDLRDIVQKFFNRFDPNSKFKEFFSRYSLGNLQAMKSRLRVIWNILEDRNGFIANEVKVEIT